LDKFLQRRFVELLGLFDQLVGLGLLSLRQFAERLFTEVPSLLVPVFVGLRWVFAFLCHNMLLAGSCQNRHRSVRFRLIRPKSQQAVRERQ
jgi:hypothetical protein